VSGATSGEPTAASPSNQVSLPRWNELKREYNLRHKALLQYATPAGNAEAAATAPEETVV
jgi:hypothetical protein